MKILELKVVQWLKALVALFQRTQVRVPVPAWQLMTVCNSSYRGSDVSEHQARM